MSLIIRFPNFVNELIAELNLARSNPKAYIPVVEQYTSTYGATEINETIAFLSRQPACGTKLVLTPGLSKLAQDFVNIQGPTGQTGHGEFNVRFGNVTYRGIAENLSYGISEARAIVAAWIIDANVPGKGHRINIFNCSYNQIGVAYGPHGKYNDMVVNIYAHGFVGRTGGSKFNGNGISDRKMRQIIRHSFIHYKPLHSYLS